MRAEHGRSVLRTRKPLHLLLLLRRDSEEGEGEEDEEEEEVVIMIQNDLDVFRAFCASSFFFLCLPTPTA